MGSTPTVFVVDDEEPIRHAFRALLETRHVPVRLFTNAGEFLSDYQDDWRGCVFADVRMPEQGGIELFRVLKLRNSHLHVVLITGSESFRSLPEFINNEVHVLEKPFSAQQLESIVRQTLYTIR